MTTTFEARCWGGPLDGEVRTCDKPIMLAHHTKPLYLVDEDPSVAVAEMFWVDRYNYERFAVGLAEGKFIGGAAGEPVLFYAWVIAEPPERQEAERAAIVNGLNVMLWIARWLGQWGAKVSGD